MRVLLNTLYVINPNYFIGARGESVTLSLEGKVEYMLPLRNLQSIVIFSHSGISARLIQKCTENNISISILSPVGQFYGRFRPVSQGNVLLRKKQVAVSLDEEESLKIARNMITAKITNTRNFLIRFRKQYSLRIVEDEFNQVIDQLKESQKKAFNAISKEELRGIEGDAQAKYYGLFDQLILTNKSVFKFQGRNRRPPLDPVNALLSFAYTLLALDCAGALEANGLDAYIGFNHVDRPGRCSLALDLEEELRVMVADRFVLRLINRGQFKESDFEFQDSGAVLLHKKARKKFLQEWQEKKYEKLTHPFLQTKIEWGLVPHIQALLLARYLRDDLDAYPPFFWR